MPNPPPAITGKQLIKLLARDGWVAGRRTRHGISLSKVKADGRKSVTIVPDKASPLPGGTLADILGPQQTCIGRDGLAELIATYGIK